MKIYVLVGLAGLSLSAESVQKRPSVKRTNSRDKRFLHRSTSKRNKENGSRSNRLELQIRFIINNYNNTSFAALKAATREEIPVHVQIVLR